MNHDTISPSLATEHTPSPQQALLKQAGISIFAECTAIAVSIGAVYAAQSLCPKRVEATANMLAKQLGRFQGTSFEAQEKLARNLTDALIMNIGGVTNMGLQFALHRQSQPPEERLPLKMELGRLLSGRAAGTLGAFSALALASPHMRYSNGHTSPASSRFSELLANNAVQSLGALAGNIPAQMLFDHLVHPANGKARAAY